MLLEAFNSIFQLKSFWFLCIIWIVDGGENNIDFLFCQSSNIISGEAKNIQVPAETNKAQIYFLSHRSLFAILCKPTFCYEYIHIYIILLLTYIISLGKYWKLKHAKLLKKIWSKLLQSLRSQLYCQTPIMPTNIVTNWYVTW